MSLDTFVIGQVAFWWARAQVKPAVIVDKMIEIFVDIAVPPRGNSQSSTGGFLTGFMDQWNSLERAMEKQERAFNIRRDLRQWDYENPDMPHAMIIKMVLPAIFSMLVTNLYLSFCQRIRFNRRRYR